MNPFTRLFFSENLHLLESSCQNVKNASKSDASNKGLYVAENADDVMSHFADSFVDNDLGNLAVNRGQDIVFMISLDSVISIH